MTGPKVPHCVACGASVKDAAQYQAARCPKAALPATDPRHTLELADKIGNTWTAYREAR